MILAVFGIFIGIKRIYYKLNNMSQVQYRPVPAVKTVLVGTVVVLFCGLVPCRGSLMLQLPPLSPAAHLIISSNTLLVSLLVSLLAARLFRLVDVGRGLSASAPTCDSPLWCLR